MPNRPPRLWLARLSRRRRITFYVDDRPFRRWYGTTVEQALTAHDQQLLEPIREGRAWITDARGDRVGLGGTVEDGARLYVRYLGATPSQAEEEPPAR